MSTKNLQILDSLIPPYDETLSETSTNAVQNKAVASAVSDLNTRIDKTNESVGSITVDSIGAAKSNHNHDSRYYTETEIDSKVSAINTSITNVVNGTTKVAKATSADSATSAASASSATKATQDGNGKVISSTYETKTDATSKLNTAKTYSDTNLATAKSYTDTKISALVNGAPTTLDTLKEVADAIEEHQDITDALDAAIGTKMNKVNPTGSGNVSFGRLDGSTIGDNSVVIGSDSKATNSNSIAIGTTSVASGKNSTAIGTGATASGDNSTVIGASSTASGEKSVALGEHNTASGEYSTAMGCWTNAPGTAAISLGNGTTANGWGAMASGIVTNAKGLGQHVFGAYNIPDSDTIENYYDSSEHLVIVGNGDVLSDNGVQSNAHTLDWSGNAWFAGDVYVHSTSGTNKDSGSKKLATESYVDSAISGKANSSHTHDDRYYTETEIDEKVATLSTAISGKANNTHNHTISEITNLQTKLNEIDANLSTANTNIDTKMDKTNPTGSGTFSFGREDGSTVGQRSVVLGSNATASGKDSAVIGRKGKATGNYATSIGYNNTASGDNSVVIGVNSTATSGNAITIGTGSQATNWNAVAIGASTTASGNNSVAMGYGSEASGWMSTTSGYMTEATGGAQTVLGSLNVADTAPTSGTNKSEHLVIVGNGDYESETPVNSNAFTLDWEGNGWFAGNVFVGSASGTNKDTGSKMLATVEQVQAKADVSHNHDDSYYTESEIDNMEFITTSDIDTIWNNIFTSDVTIIAANDAIF